METTTTTRYEIITRFDGEWTNDGIGTPNEFATRAEAEAAIEELRALGDDWAEAEYDVREIEG